MEILHSDEEMPAFIGQFRGWCKCSGDSALKRPTRLAPEGVRVLAGLSPGPPAETSGHEAAKLRVFSLVHHTHPTTPQLFQER